MNSDAHLSSAAALYNGDAFVDTAGPISASTFAPLTAFGASLSCGAIAPATPAGRTERFPDPDLPHNGENFVDVPMDGTAPPAAAWEGEQKLTAEEAWTILCETPDITSPEEYPDHALITIEQLASFMARAATSPAKKSPATGGAGESGNTEARGDLYCSRLNVHPSQQTQQHAAEKNGQGVSGDPHGPSPLSECRGAFCTLPGEESSTPASAATGVAGHE